MDFDYYKNIANSILNADIDKAKEKLEIICNSGIFDNPDFPKTDNKLYINYVTRHLERLLYLTICEIHPQQRKCAERGEACAELGATTVKPLSNQSCGAQRSQRATGDEIAGGQRK